MGRFATPFAAYLEQARSKGTNQEQLAGRVKLSPAALCNYKHPHANPGIRIVQSLARELSKILGTPLSSDDLFPPVQEVRDPPAGA